MLKNMSNGEDITRYVSLSVNQQTRTIVSNTYDGRWHIQQVGIPAVHYAVTAYVDRDGKSRLMSAQGSLDLLGVTVGHGVYYGRITELSFGERMAQGWFRAAMTLAKEAL